MNIYYKNKKDSCFYLYDGVKVKTQKNIPEGYEMIKTFGIEGNEEGLIEYYEKIIEYSKELNDYLTEYVNNKGQKQFKNMNMEFFKEGGDNSSLMYIILSNTRKDKPLKDKKTKDKKTKDEKTLETYEHVSYEEYKFLDGVYGTGLIAGIPYEGTAYAYDQKKFYSKTYGCGIRNFKFPIKRGRLETLEELDLKNIKYGVYRVRIISNDPRAKFLIGFSKKNYYDHYTLKKLNFFKNKVGISISWNLITDGKPNALIYDDNTLIDSERIFGYYQFILNEASELYPKNPLIKFMLNKMYGLQLIKNAPIKRKLSSINKLSEEEKSKIIPILSKSYKNEKGEKIYQTVSKDRIFLYTTARMGYFLPATCRAKMSGLISPIINDVVRIYIDGFITKTNNDGLTTKFICKDKKYHLKHVEIKNAQTVIIH